MSLDGLIEAEEAAGHSVKRCCELFEVSRAAYYQRKKQEPSARELGDAELLQKIREVYDDSDGTYGAPRVAHELSARNVVCGRRRVRRLMRQAGLDRRCKKRRPKTTIQDRVSCRFRGCPEQRFRVAGLWVLGFRQPRGPWGGVVDETANLRLVRGLVGAPQPR